MAGSQQTAAPSAGRPSYFGVVLCLALVVQSSLVYGATPPSVEADGVSLSLKAGTDGDVVLVTDAGSVKASDILAMVPVVTDHVGYKIMQMCVAQYTFSLETHHQDF